MRPHETSNTAPREAAAARFNGRILSCRPLMRMYVIPKIALATSSCSQCLTCVHTQGEPCVQNELWIAAQSGTTKGLRPARAKIKTPVCVINYEINLQ